MHRIRKFLTAMAVLVSSLTCSPGEEAGRAESGHFGMVEGNGLRVEWKGKPLILGERVSYVSDRAQMESRWDQREGRVSANVWTQEQDGFFRREVTLSGGEVELMAGLHVPAYPEKTEVKELVYTFEVSLAALGEAEFEAIVGRTYEPTPLKGKVSPQMADGALLSGRGARWIEFKTQQGRLVFDLNPEGVVSYSDFGPADLIGLWVIRKRGAVLEFSIGRGLGVAGALVSGNVVILEDENIGYKDRHLHTSFLYFGAIPESRRFVFSKRRIIMGDILAFESLKEGETCGWENIENLELQPANPGSSYREYLGGKEKGVFVYRAGAPGLYAVTIQTALGETGVGPYSVTSNGRLLQQDVRLKGNTYSIMSYTQWLEGGRLELQWSGEWAASAVTVQPLLHKKEDFSFTRDVWREKDLPVPADYRTGRGTPAVYAVDFHCEELAGEVADASAPVSKPVKWALPAKGAMPWRFEGAVFALGMDLHSVFQEFNTPERIGRRLDELKEQGAGIIMVEGLHARHLYPESWARMRSNVAAIVKAAHARGIKVIDHYDIPLVWHRGNGLRYLTENVAWMQRSIYGGGVARGVNFLHPEFKAAYFQQMKAYVKETGIDGVMLDEVSFFGREFDFSPATRQQFKEATGLVIPIDERNSIINNFRSATWKSWLQWRNEAVRDWYAELRAALREIKPDFSIMRYTTNSGVTNATNFIQAGADLFTSAQSIDFVGCEVMSRNVLQSYRANFTYRRFFSGFRTLSNHPIYGLIYSDNPDIQSFGWALLNMNAQTIWTYAELPKEQRKYLYWRDNMNLKEAVDLADVGMIYSESTRNWALTDAKARHHQDALGLSQLLAKDHVQHEFLFEAAIDDERLDAYRLVIAPDVACLSDRALEALLRYVERGGRLMISGDFALFDEWGIRKDREARARLLEGISLSKPTDQSVDVSLQGGHRLSVQRSFPLPLLVAGEKQRIIARVDGEPLKGMATEHPLGSGTVYVTVAALGFENFEREHDVNEVVDFEENEGAAELFRRVLAEMLPSQNRAFRSLSIPPKVLTTVYRDQSRDDEKVVHLLNATGVNLKKGEKLTAQPSQPAFPPIAGEIAFEIEDSREALEATAYSPITQARVALPIHRVSPGRWQINVPGWLLDPYCMVRITEPEPSLKKPPQRNPETT